MERQQRNSGTHANDTSFDQTPAVPAGKRTRTRQLAASVTAQRKKHSSLDVHTGYVSPGVEPPRELCVLDHLRANEAKGLGRASIQMKRAPNAPSGEPSPAAAHGDVAPDGADLHVLDGGLGMEPIDDPITPMLSAVKNWAETAFKSLDGDLSKLTGKASTAKTGQSKTGAKPERTSPDKAKDDGEHNGDSNGEAGGEATDEDPAAASNPDDEKPGSAAVQHKGAADRGQVRGAAEVGIAGGGSQLPFFSRIQSSFGRHDVRHVQSHVGGSARAANAKMGSIAYTMGEHVAFGGTPDLHTAAHEAAHVIQQRRGVSLKGGVGEAGDEFEQHADRVADAVVRDESAEPLLDEYAGSEGGEAGVQHKMSLCDTNAPATPPLKGFSEYPAFYIRNGPQEQSHLFAGKDYLAFIDKFGKSASAAVAPMQQLNSAWDQLMNIHDSGCAAISQALAAALSSEVKIEGNALDCFGNLRSEVNKLGGAIDDLHRVGEKTKFVTQLETVAHAMVSKLEAEVEQKTVEEEKEELIKKYEERAKKTAALVGKIVDPLAKLIEGKELEAVEAVMTKSIEGGVEEMIEHYYSTKAAAAIEPLKAKLASLQAEIKVANGELAEALGEIVEPAIKECELLDKKANDTIRDSQGNIRLHIHAMATLKGDENAEIRNLFGLIENHLDAVDPPAAAVLTAADAVSLPGSGGEFQYLDTVLAASERQVRASFDDQYGTCSEEQTMEEVAEAEAARRNFDTWVAQNQAIRAWCKSAKAWATNNSKQVSFARQFASGPHRAKAEDALNIVNSHMASMSGGGKLPAMNWGHGQTAGKKN